MMELWRGDLEREIGETTKRWKRTVWMSLHLSRPRFLELGRFPASRVKTIECEQDLQRSATPKVIKGMQVRHSR